MSLCARDQRAPDEKHEWVFSGMDVLFDMMYWECARCGLRCYYDGRGIEPSWDFTIAEEP